MASNINSRGDRPQTSDASQRTAAQAPPQSRSASPKPPAARESTADSMERRVQGAHDERAVEQPAPQRPADVTREGVSHVSTRPQGPPPLLNREYVASYAPSDQIDARIDEGCTAAEDGDLTQAYKIWDSVIADAGTAVAWQKVGVGDLARLVTHSFTTSRDPASTGEAFLEIALTLQQSDPKRAQALYTALNDHRELLREATRCAPLYNLACVIVEPLDAPSPAEMKRGMGLLIESMKDTLRGQDAEDLAATHELLPRTDGSLWRLHAEHKPFMERLQSVMAQADGAGAQQIATLCQQLDALKP